MVSPESPMSSPENLSSERVAEAVENLVPGLQRNIAKIAIYGDEIEPELRLRDRLCGPVATAVSEKLIEAGMPTRPVISDIRDLSEQFPRTSRHHVVAISGYAADPIIIDATFGQLFRPFGLDMWFAHDKLPGQDPYPTQQALVFKASQTPETSKFLADWVEDFWKKYASTDAFNEYWQHSQDSIIVRSNGRLNEYFESIYSLERYRPFKIRPRSRPTVDRLLEDL